MKVGDYVVDKMEMADPNPNNVYRVIALNELWYQVDWFHDATGTHPLTLTLTTRDGTNFAACPDDYIVVDGYDPWKISEE